MVAPVSGTIEVCDKPGVNCRKLAGGADGPARPTVDARKGVVVLSSVGADGKVQTAKFYDGMFKVTQSAATTDLTLNEPLAPCAARRPGPRRRSPRRASCGATGRASSARAVSTARRPSAAPNGSCRTRCAGTLTRVKQGVVSVRDKVKGKTITLRAGKRYTAKPRRG